MDFRSIETPCRRVCALDIDRVCIACGRTIQEIIDWETMSAEERRAIMVRLGAEDQNGRRR